MENLPAYTDERKQMSEVADVTMASNYVGKIGGAGQVAVILQRAYDKLSAMFPHRDSPERQWTERRVRAFWNKEAATVQFREMVELHRAAEAAIAERQMLAEARKEHAAFIEKTASLRALLERQDEDFHRPQIEGLGRVPGGMDRSGTEG